jgi:hypothetical protein
MVSFTNTIIATFAIVSLAQAGPLAAVVRGVSTVASIASSVGGSKNHRDLIRGESSIFERGMFLPSHLSSFLSYQLSHHTNISR